jgi:hypothetical protein
MELGPKPERTPAEERELIEDVLKHIGDLSMPADQKEFLKSLILYNQPGSLMLRLNNDHPQEIIITEDTTPVEIAEEISETLDDLYEIALKEAQGGIVQESLTLGFTPSGRLH